MSKHCLLCYVLPRAIYGSEVMSLLKTQKDKLNSAYCRLLEQIQGLPLRASNAASYILLGTLPLVAQIDLRILSLLGAISRSGNETLFGIAMRLTSVKPYTSRSWFVKCEKLLIKYNLPHILEVLEIKPGKAEWKRLCKAAVHSHWSETLHREAATKTSLRYLSLDNCSTRIPHQCWSSIGASVREVQKAGTKLRIAVGTYLTMANAQKYFKCDPVCRLCHKETETVPHMLLTCPALHEARGRYLPRLKCALETHDIPITFDNVLQASLDVTKLPGPSSLLNYGLHRTTA